MKKSTKANLEVELTVTVLLALAYVAYWLGTHPAVIDAIWRWLLTGG